VPIGTVTFMLTGIGVDPTLARARPAGYAEALAEGRSAINRSAGSKANNADVEIDDHAREEYWSEIRGQPENRDKTVANL
jgi:hypothetical protein